MYTRIIAFLLVAISVAALSCEKRNTPSPVHSLSVSFKGKPFSEIRSYIIGPWKVVYTSGGIAGQTVYNTDDVVNFGALDSMIWLSNNLRIASYTIDSFQTNNGTGDSVYLLHPGYMALGTGIINDTLFLNEVGIMDGYRYCLVKIITEL